MKIGTFSGYLFTVCKSREITPFPFVLFEEEAICYYFQETKDNETVSTDKMILENEKSNAGKYGRINSILKMSPASRKMAMAEYAQEERLAERLFKMY